MMQHENIQPPAKPPKKKRRSPPELKAEELEFLKVKRFISEWDVMRFFQICESTLYNWIKTGELLPTRIGGKKLFDLQDIYRRLEEGKGK